MNSALRITVAAVATCAALLPATGSAATAERKDGYLTDTQGGIVRAIGEAQERSDIGCILLSAAGSVFCAGMDLDEAAQADGERLFQAHDDVFSIGAASLKPLVVCVNGAALGGGLGLVAQGHVVIASDLAVFGLPEIHLGLWPFVVYRPVEAALGTRRTLQLSLTGDLFQPAQALDWGLVHRICPSVELAVTSKAPEPAGR